MNRYHSRKFLLTLFLAAVGSAGLFVGKMSGSEFVAFTTLLLGVHHGANVVDAYLNTTPPAMPPGAQS